MDTAHREDGGSGHIVADEHDHSDDAYLEATSSLEPEDDFVAVQAYMTSKAAASDGQEHKAAKTEVSTDNTMPRLAKARLWDKIAFVLGSTSMWVCAFWLGRTPQSFWRLYTVVGMVLFTARFAVYRARKWHYYLLDLCYACNALLLVHLWLAPHSKLLARTTFAFNTGPLTTSIMAFRNSLVYHDMDRVTSLFLHLVPACVSWTQKWYADPQRFDKELHSGPAGVVDLILIPLAFYVVWAAVYSFVIFVLAAKRIQRKGYVTLFTYVTTRKRGTYAEIARRVPKPIQPMVYLVMHMAFCGASLLLALMAWRSFLAHTVLLIVVASMAIANGGTYYFEVFAKRHRTSGAENSHAGGTPGTAAVTS